MRADLEAGITSHWIGFDKVSYNQACHSSVLVLLELSLHYWSLWYQQGTWSWHQSQGVCKDGGCHFGAGLLVEDGKHTLCRE